MSLGGIGEWIDGNAGRAQGAVANEGEQLLHGVVEQIATVE